MAEKLKVHPQVSLVLKDLIQKYGEEEMLTMHAAGWEDWHVLSGISMVDMARAIVVGYKVEPTPEEKLAATFLDKKRAWEESDEPQEVEWEKGFTAGIQYAIGILDIKIEGINK